MTISDELPRIDPQGVVDLDSIREMDVDLLAFWIERVLRLDDTRVSGNRDDRPYLYLGRLYRGLSADVREAFQDSLISLIAGADADADSRFPFDELLLLLTEVFTTIEGNRRFAPIPYLRMIADQRPDDYPDSAHRRALQAIVSLRYGAEPAFWKRQFESWGDRYAGVAFAGLSLLGFEEAFRWLMRHPRNPAVIQALLKRLPLLLQEQPQDRESLVDLLHELCYLIPQKELGELVEFAKVHGLTLYPSPFLHYSETQLGELSRALDISFEFPRGVDRSQRISIFEDRLHSTLPEGISGRGLNESVLTLLAVFKHPNVASLTEEQFQNIRTSASNIAESISKPTAFELIRASIEASDLRRAKKGLALALEVLEEVV